MIDNAVIVTSLPRTGTTSMRQMLETLGYKSYHTPLDRIFELYGPGVAFSDTPSYAPSVINHFIAMPESQTTYVYVDRDFDSWFDSMTKSTNLLLTQERMAARPINELTDGQRVDVKYYAEVFGSFSSKGSGFRELMKIRFNEHRERVKGLGLVYKFEDGWGPLCEYLGLNIPDDDIPHLHKISIGKNK